MIFGLKLKNIIFILVGSAIFSFGIVHFNMQNNLSEGGFTGITLLLYFAFKWDPAISNIILNIPVFFAGWKFLGRNTFFIRSLARLLFQCFYVYSRPTPLSCSIWNMIWCLSHCSPVFSLEQGLASYSAMAVRQAGQTSLQGLSINT